MSVRRLKRHAIDDDRWDAAVLSIGQSFPYGLSWWLDAVTGGSWEGLVLDDYRVVMPLPKLRRYGFIPAYLRPPFTQQLGPFGTLEPGDLKDLLHAVPFSLQIALPLVITAPVEEVPEGFSMRRRINYVLDLSKPLEQTKKQFPKTVRSLIRKSSEDRLEPADPARTIHYYRSHLRGRGGLRDFHFARLADLIAACQSRGVGDCYQLRDADELLAIGFFPTFRGRTINLTAASTEAGMNRRGMSRLLALLFARDSGVPGNCFDFEGSELPGVKEYFAKFGGTDEGYFLVEKKLLIR